MGNLCDVPAGQKRGGPGPQPIDAAAEESESVSEEDSGGEDIIAPPKFNRGPRTSVSAEAYGAHNQPSKFVAPVYQKTPEQRARLSRAVKGNTGFMFQALEPSELEQVIDAMQEKVLPEGQIVIRQGDEVNDMDPGLYILEEGRLAVHKATGGAPAPGPQVHEYSKQGDQFGELAILYNCPRAATVITSGPCKLWFLQRASFNNLVKGACIKKRSEYAEFLSKVPLLKALKQDEVGKLADVLRSRQIQRGDVLCTEGEPGDLFFLLVEGACAAQKNGATVYEYKKSGDFFGELALKSASDGLRKASVICTAPGSVVTIDRASFRRLLGPLDKLLEERADEYQRANQSLR